MTARFVPPTPNCGHVEGVTFTYVVDAEIFMCALCIASIGPLYRRCTNCGQPPRPGTQLITGLSGHLCFTCQRELRTNRRASRFGST